MSKHQITAALSATQLKNILDNARGSTGNLLSTNYKISLVKTYIRLYTPLKRDNYVRLYSTKTNRTPKSFFKLATLRMKTLLYALHYDTNDFSNANSATLEVMIILKLLISTNLNHNNVFELTDAHYEELVTHKALAWQNVVVEPTLFQYVLSSINNLRKLRKARYNPKRPSQRHEKYFIVNTADSINKRLRELFVLVTAASTNIKNGRGGSRVQIERHLMEMDHDGADKNDNNTSASQISDFDQLPNLGLRAVSNLNRDFIQSTLLEYIHVN